MFIGVNSVKYTNPADLFAHLRDIADTKIDVMHVYNISVEEFRALDLARDGGADCVDGKYIWNPKFSVLNYRGDKESMVIKQFKNPDALITTNISNEILHALSRAGVGSLQDIFYQELSAFGKSTYEDAGPPFSAAEGDNLWLREESVVYEDFPVLVLDSGTYGSQRYLAAKKDWWFTASKFKVKVVLTVRIDPRKRAITIEKWKASEKVVRAGATATRASTQRNLYDMKCFQSLTVRPRPDLKMNKDRVGKKETYVVEGGPMTLDIEDLLLRPRKETEEVPVLDEEELRKIAALAWRFVYS